MSYRLTSTELNTIRKPQQASDLYLSVYEPPVVYAGQVTGTYALGDRFVTVYNTATGTLANVNAGQTLYFGSTPYNDDLGRVRVVEVSGDTIKVATDKTLDLQQNQYVTVRNFYEIWPVFPLAVLDDVTRQTTFYKDYDIAYTDQNEQFDPVVIMGGNYAGFYATGQSYTYFSASGTYCNDFGINTIVWEFPPGSSVTIYTGTTPGYVQLPTTPGHYVVKCTAYAASGKSRTGKRHYSLYNRPGEGPNTPVLDWKLTELNGSFEDGWMARIEVGAGADRLKDGYICVLFADDFYGGERLSLGGYPGQSHIVFVGYVHGAETRYNAFTNKTTFLLKGTALYLKNKQMFSVTLETTGNAVDWTQLNNMTFNKIVDHYLRWHSTLLDVVDFSRVEIEHGYRYDQFEDIPKQEVAENLNSVARRIFGRFTSDKLGRCYIDVDLNMLPTGSRPSSIQSILDTDWIESIPISEVMDKPMSDVLMGGIAYDGLTSGSAFLSRAPGLYPGIGYTGRTEQIDGLILPSNTGTAQTYVNILSGLYFAKINNRYTGLVLDSINNFRNIDVVPQGYLDYSLSSGTTFRRLGINKRVIPRRVSVKYKNNRLTQAVEFETESYGKPGETYIIPTDPPDIGPDPNDDDIPTPETQPGPDDYGGKQTWVVTQDFIGYTENLTASNPHYINKTGIVNNNEVIMDFVLDPFDPTNTAFALTQKGIYKTVNASAYTPAWQKVFSIEGVSSNQFSSTLSPQFTRIKTTIAQKGRLYAMAYAKTSAGSNNYNLYIYRTDDGGSTWLRYSTPSALVNGPWFSLGYLGANLVSSVGAINPENIEKATSDCVNYARIVGGGNIVVDLGGLYKIEQARSKGTFDGINSYTFLDGSTDGSTWSGLLGTGFWIVNGDCSTYSTSPAAPTFVPGTYRYLRINQEPFALGNKTEHYVFELYITEGTPPISSFSKALDCGQHNPDKVYYSDGVSIYRSTNAGVSWSVYISQGAYDVECPYSGNPTDDDITFWATNQNLYKSSGNNAGSALLTESDVALQHRRTCTYVQSDTGQTIFVVEATSGTQKRLRRTYNGGASWQTGQTGIAGATQLGLWPYNETRVFLLSDTEILYSNDAGDNFGVKNGDWTSVMGLSFQSPVMIVPNWLNPN